MGGKLFTIGYANKTPLQFAELCHRYGVNCIVDVRSSPFSGHFPEYNEPRLRDFLSGEGIAYLSFKKEFGARRDEDEAYSPVLMDDGELVEVVDFEKVYRLPAFQKGVERVMNGLSKGYSIAFMCSEKDAVDCHRAIMVGCYFAANGFDIEHIIDKENGSYSQEELLKRIHDNFHRSANRFKRKNGIDSLDSIQASLFDAPIFDDPEYIRFWKNFYRVYSPEKGIRLRNYQIGYKKGGEGNG